MTTRSKVTFASINKNKSNTKANLTRTSLALFLGFSLVNSNVAISADTAINRAISGETNQTYKISPGPLGVALSMFASQSKVLLSFDPTVTDGKNSAGLNGSYNLNDGFKLLLKGTGLTVVSDQKGGYQLEKLPIVKGEQDLPLNAELSVVEVRAKRFYEIGPLPGLGLTKEQIPGNVQSVTAKEIKDSHSLSMADLLNKNLQSVNVNDYQGNPFQMDITYRGFTASPQLGTPQGLSVFFDGIRVNEPFGDVVNWDMIPMNALAGVDVFPGSNPIFGLGTLGGAFAMKTKSGFDSEGTDAEILTGSFGRKQLQVSSGWNNGTIGLFGAGNFFMEDGWRDNSPSKVNQFFGKASYRGDKLDLNLSTLIVGNDLVGNGLVPSELYQQKRNGVFTSPDSTDNRLKQFQLSGSYFVNDNFTITAQAYRRDSKRHSIGGDVYTDYEGTANGVNRNLRAGEEFTCLFNSTNKYGLPDYYIIDLPNNDFSQSDFFNDYFTTGVPNIELIKHTFNQDLPDDFAKHAMAEFNFWKAPISSIFYRPADDGGPDTSELPPFGEETDYSNGEISYIFNGTSVVGNLEFTGDDSPINPFAGLAGFYYYTPDGVKHLFTPIKAINGENCRATQNSESGNVGDVRYLNPLDPRTNDPQITDGGGTLQPGVVEGTPTAVLTDNQINQLTDGASLQLNWNFEHHKFMVGASIDRPTATYINKQRLGLLDEKRNAYLAPDEIRDQYAAADQDISNNDFDGYSITKSIYASETWSPTETLNFTGAIRYNETHGKNTLAQRLKGESFARLAYYQNIPDLYNICPNGVCPTTGYKPADLADLIQKPESEKFSYYSLNPSLGATWQPNPNLNIYGNWAQGVRTPSVIELGCAFDHTLIDIGPKHDINGVEIGRNVLEKSLAEGRSCQLPSTLSGDPYLPQIKAQTYDLGIRGVFSKNFANAIGATTVEWNLGAFRTNLKDDIYLITYPGNRSFFDTVGKTRRQGIEAGVTASFGKTSLKLNYALTDATFQDTFSMAADDNSSATIETKYCNSNGTCQYSDDRVGRIKVKPGNRMPGVPLHNLNATISYEVTPKWKIGFSGIAHSDSFLRGNENNEHQAGVTRYEIIQVPDPANPGRHLLVTQARQPTTNKSKVSGYATFNFQTSYKLAEEWTATMLINNVFDKEYFSAGRLGRNPFSPSINGAIGPSGYNHNSSDWLSTNFIAPGAPRGIWFSLNWQFDPNKK